MITLTMLLLPDCMSSGIFSTFSSIFLNGFQDFYISVRTNLRVLLNFLFQVWVAILLLASNVNIALGGLMFCLKFILAPIHIIYTTFYPHYLSVNEQYVSLVFVSLKTNHCVVCGLIQTVDHGHWITIIFKHICITAAGWNGSMSLTILYVCLQSLCQTSICLQFPQLQ